VFVGFVAFARRFVFPAAAESVPLAGRLAFTAALFQPLLEVDAVLCGVALDAVAAQQPIHPQPGRPFGGSQVKGEAAPSVRGKRLVGRDETGADRVEMHVIAGGAQVIAAAFVDDERLVTAGEQVREELMAAVEANIGSENVSAVVTGPCKKQKGFLAENSEEPEKSR